MTAQQEQLIKEVYEAQSKIFKSSEIEEIPLLMNFITEKIQGLKFISDSIKGEIHPLNEVQIIQIQELKSIGQEIVENGLTHIKTKYSEIDKTVKILLISVSGAALDEINEVVEKGTTIK